MKTCIETQKAVNKFCVNYLRDTVCAVLFWSSINLTHSTVAVAMLHKQSEWMTIVASGFIPSMEYKGLKTKGYQS